MHKLNAPQGIISKVQAQLNILINSANGQDDHPAIQGARNEMEQISRLLQRYPRF
ncbi:hypothetical protein D3C71_2178460 [compost metagenome]